MEVTASELTHSSSCSLELQRQAESQTHVLLHTAAINTLALHSQGVAEVVELLQGLLTPAPLGRDPAARTGPSLGALRGLGPVLCLPLLAHVDGEGPAVELQHSLLEHRSGGEEEQGPDDGDGALLEAPGPWAAETTAALVLPRLQLLQTAWRRKSDR